MRYDLCKSTKKLKTYCFFVNTTDALLQKEKLTAQNAHLQEGFSVHTVRYSKNSPNLMVCRKNKN